MRKKTVRPAWLTDDLKQKLRIAAMWVPPWNLFWWIVGFVFYHLSGMKKDDHSGDTELSFVLYAPVTIPALPFVWWRERQEVKELKAYEARCREAAIWICRMLDQRGIDSNKVRASWDGVHVVVEALLRSQEADYAEVMAQAIHFFSDLEPEDLCEKADPLRPLNQAWAQKYGISTWAEEVFYSPCGECGRVDSCGFRFGSGVAWLRKHNAETSCYVQYADGERKVYPGGYVCSNCLKARPWTSQGSPA